MSEPDPLLADLDLLDNDDIDDLLEDFELDRLLSAAAPLPKQPTFSAPIEPEPEPELEQPAASVDPRMADILPDHHECWFDAGWMMSHPAEMLADAKARVALNMPRSFQTN